MRSPACERISHVKFAHRLVSVAGHIADGIDNVDAPQRRRTVVGGEYGVDNLVSGTPNV